MRKSVFTTVMAAVFAFMAMTPVFAGSLDAPSAPGLTNSYTLDSIWNRLNDGTPGTQSTFTGPPSGAIGATGHTLDEVMAKAPAVDNTNGATAGDVMNNKTFWGLTAGAWGLKTGTLACAATSTGTATAGDVLATMTFSNSSANGITGTMANKGATSFTPGTTAQTITAGYYNGSGSVAGDAELIPGNIKSGVDIFGVTGTFACGAAATGDAVAADVLTGKTFSNGTSSNIAGGMTDNGAVTITPGATAKPIPAGYHNGSGTVATDANLLAANIVSGKTIFGVAGSASAATVPAPVPGTGQIGCWDAGGTSVPCAGTGQDGDKLKGVANPSPRFTDNSNGTVTDNLTGLIWLRNANCFLGGLNWATALTNVNGLANGLCSLTDGSTAGQWRLPNLRELQSLIDYQNEDHALPAGYSSFFSNVQAGFYWSATTRIADKTNAWLVDMNGGVDFHAKTFVGPVWPVR